MAIDLEGKYDLIKPYVLTGSFYSFTQSYYIDSTSFDYRINNITFDTSSFATRVELNAFTESYYIDSSSVDTRINNLVSETSSYVTISQTSSLFVSHSIYSETASYSENTRTDAIQIQIYDSDYIITGSINQNIHIETITALRNITLPSAHIPKQIIKIIDNLGNVSLTNRLRIYPSGSDTINGRPYKLQINPRTNCEYISDGMGNWCGTTAFTRISTGVLIQPTFIDNGSGSITIGDSIYNLYSDPSGSGPIGTYEITGSTFTLTDLTTNYVIADYDNGTPYLRVITDVTLINETTIIPVFTIYREGNRLHYLQWKNLGLGLVNRLHQSIVKTQRYRLQSGLVLSESGSRAVMLSEGIVWVGANNYTLSAFDSTINDLFFLYRSGGVWQTPTFVTQYNNSQYDDGDLKSLSGTSKYAVNYIYRGVETDTECYMVLGGGNYSLIDAQASLPPVNLPPLITSHAVLVGRIIVQNGLNVAKQIDRIFDPAFALSPSIDHNDTSNKDGGDATGYYHFTADEHTTLQNISSSYYIDSSSFDSKINTKLNTSSFDSFTQSYYTDSQSFNTRISGINVSSSTDDSLEGNGTPSFPLKVASPVTTSINYSGSLIQSITQSYAEANTKYTTYIYDTASFVTQIIEMQGLVTHSYSFIRDINGNITNIYRT